MALSPDRCWPYRVGPVEKIVVNCKPADAELLVVDQLNAVIQDMTTREMLFGGFELAIDGQPP